MIKFYLGREKLIYVNPIHIVSVQKKDCETCELCTVDGKTLIVEGQAWELAEEIERKLR